MEIGFKLKNEREKRADIEKEIKEQNPNISGEELVKEVEKRLKEFKKKKAREEAEMKFTGNSKWFYDLLETIERIREEEDKNITDILVMEDNVVYGGTGKKNWRLTDNIIKRENISELVRTILPKVKQLPERDDLNFSAAIFGFGTFRFNLSQDDRGYGLAIRVLPYEVPRPENIHYNERIFYIFNKLIDNDYISRGGLVIHAGPTGSGKTTSIAVELDYIADKISGTILTYENPIEYRFDINKKAQIRQFEIGLHLSDYDMALRHLLRNNPSVCFIGEVQTREDLEKVIDIGSRGHLTFTTLHANNVYEALKFLSSVDESVARKRMASNLIAVISHKQVVFTYDGPKAKEEGIDGKVDIYPIFEVFQPSTPEIAHLSNGEIDRIKQSYYHDRTIRDASLLRMTFSESFNDTFNKLLTKGYITKSTFDRLKEHLRPLFEER